MNKWVISLLVIFLIKFNSLYAKNRVDSITTRTLQEVSVMGIRPIPERLKDVENEYLFTAKKNEVLRLDQINANTASNNARQVFARIPGVSIWEYDGSGIQVNVATRGLNPNRSWEFNTRQNGYDISADVFGYPEAYYHPSFELVEKIQVIRGAASLQFGSQFGGVLNYVMKRQTKNTPLAFESQTTLGSYGLLGNYTSISGNTHKINYTIANHIRKGNGWRANSWFETRNSYLYFQWKWSDKIKSSLEYTNADYLNQQPGGLTDQQFQKDASQSYRARNWFSAPWNLLCLNIDVNPNAKLFLNLKLFGLLGERNSVGFLSSANVSDTINKASASFNSRQVDRDGYLNFGAEFRGVFHYSIAHKNHDLSFGARIYKTQTERKQKGVGTKESYFDLSISGDRFPTHYSFSTDNIAFFVENTFRIGKNFSITPGARFEYIYSSITGRSNILNGVDIMISPSHLNRNIFLGGIGLQYQILNTNIYANITQAFRPILFSHLVPSATTDIIDPNLKDISGFNAEIGYRGSVAHILNFDVSGFYIQYDNQIGDVSKFMDNDPNKGTYLYRTNLGSAVHFGAELYTEIDLLSLITQQHKLGKLNFFVSLSFLSAKYQSLIVTSVTGSAPNINIKETNMANKRVAYAPEYIHNFGLTYTFKNLSFTAQTRWMGDVFTDAQNTEAPSSNGNNGKIDGYLVFDFSAEYKFLEKFNLKAGAQNFTDTRYATRRSGGFPGPGLIVGEARSFYISLGVKF